MKISAAKRDYFELEIQFLSCDITYEFLPFPQKQDWNITLSVQLKTSVLTCLDRLLGLIKMLRIEALGLRSKHLQAPYLDSILGIIKTAGSKVILLYTSSLARSLKFK